MDKEQEKFIKAIADAQRNIQEAKEYLLRQGLVFTTIALLETQIRRLQDEISIFKGAIYAKTAASKKA